jgi:quercetin dioxygenase-like cupin family protein
MTLQRSSELQSFLTSAETAIRHRAAPQGPMREAADRIFTALRTPAAESAQPARSPVCDHLPAALDNARRQPSEVGALADAFAGIESRLRWQARAFAEVQSDAFLKGHANATIVGADGVEVRHDVRVGVSLMAPHLQYPDHRHPPEEIYVVLSPGEWRQDANAWHEPGLGGLVYNPPNIVHAMRSLDAPLLAFWFLWM